MRRKRLLLVLVLGLFSPGCMLIENGFNIAKTEVRDCVDDAREHHRNKSWAEETWRQICKTEPNTYSQDHARGFKEGFAEYLYSGNDVAPAVAPSRYRKFRYQTPEGYQAIEDWFAGYRHGVAIAIETGYRRLITGPSSASFAGEVLPVVAVPVSPAERLEIMPRFGRPRTLDPSPAPLTGETHGELTQDWHSVNTSTTVILDARPAVKRSAPPTFGIPKSQTLPGVPRLQPPIAVDTPVEPASVEMPMAPETDGPELIRADWRWGSTGCMPAK